MTKESILRKGTNCWRIERADRLAFLVNGEAYFRAFRRAALKAKRSIHILAWDIHHAIELERGETEGDAPTKLAPLLHYLVDGNPELEIHILVWDYAFIYALERDWHQKRRVRGRHSDRIHFHADNQHPTGASQHQKVVIIDQQIAFAGGLDLSVWRWDTSEHLADHPERTDPYNEPYQPYHDVQVLMEGAAALALEELFLERWQHATGESLNLAPSPPPSSPWPGDVDAHLENVDVALARTFSAHGERTACREVEQLYLDAIKSAQEFIYIQNQYLSSQKISDALAARLKESEGPEVILILPENTGGWLEKHTMDLMRIRLIQQLQAADTHQRLGVYFPVPAGDGEFGQVYVHSKLQIVDDRFIQVGSANLSNRSMGLDSECDVALEATDDDRIRDVIRRFREDLLAEHFGWSDQERATQLKPAESILETINRSVRDSGKSLVPLRAEFKSDLDRNLAEAQWLDPEQPVDPEVWATQFFPEEQRVGAKGRIIALSSMIAIALVLLALWRWGPLAEVVDADAVEELFDRIKAHSWSPVLAFLVFLVGGSCGVPLNLILVAATVVFGPWLGFLYGYLGAVGSSVAVYGVGHMTGKPIVRRFAGSKWRKLDDQLEEKGLIFVALVRLVPVAPFLVVNLVAGVSRIRFRDFLLGTALGLAPGMLAVTFLTDRFKVVLQHPSPATIAILVATVGVMITAVVLLRRWLGKKEAQA